MHNPSVQRDEPLEDLSRIFPDGCIVTLSPGTDRCSAIKTLVDATVTAGRLPREAGVSILSSLLDRERFGASGLWRGVALPHLRTRLVTQVVGAVGIAHDGIDFGAMDGVPAQVVFLVLSPFDRRITHLQVLSRLAAMIQDPTLVAVLRSAKTASDLSRLWRK